MTGSDTRLGPGAALRYRWIVTDLDGTLVDRDLTMVPRSREALRAFRSAGGEVVIATGRSAASGRRYYDELGLTGPAILLNGALIANLHTGDVLHESRFDETAWTAVRAVVETLPPDVAAVAFVGERALATHQPAWVDAYAARDRITVEHIENWHDIDGISKVMLLCADTDAAHRIAAVAHSAAEVTVVMSEATYVELLPPGVDKGVALRWLADHEQVALAEVAAVGDNPNDVPLLRASGFGVAVGDGHPEVLAAACAVAGTCLEGAVADVVAIAIGPAPTAE
ncbi:Cof-type HAD-IIB family hydrolase [Micromonospora sp. RTGN7]|uniref:Cof-type HAD-IIB family hydrolase n=1 Tax=Micromonospora sp. RTGN7 TaxID=3016526 RepID=UPI0029FF291E|nr:Cof-type HAD-IIB family hydrolase [Micromonospora sp. RTGN7]